MKWLKSKLKLGLAVVFAAIVLDGLYLLVIWPDWQELAQHKTPKSNFIKNYEIARKANSRLPRLRWQPGPPPARQLLGNAYVKPFIVAEDSRFYTHPGIDAEALADAMRYNWNRGRFALGASTISQQTVKNLFLSGSRNPLRKWHELLLTLAMESELKKSEILSLYLNVAEFGPGVFGIKAAAAYYYAKNWADLDLSERIALAASLPSPKRHNPKTQTAAFQHRVKRISRILVRPDEKLPAVEDYNSDEGFWDDFIEDQDNKAIEPAQSIESKEKPLLLTGMQKLEYDEGFEAPSDLSSDVNTNSRSPLPAEAESPNMPVDKEQVADSDVFMTESDDLGPDEQAAELQADFTPSID